MQTVTPSRQAGLTERTENTSSAPCLGHPSLFHAFNARADPDQAANTPATAKAESLLSLDPQTSGALGLLMAAFRGNLPYT